MLSSHGTKDCVGKLVSSHVHVCRTECVHAPHVQHMALTLFGHVLCHAPDVGQVGFASIRKCAVDVCADTLCCSRVTVFQQFFAKKLCSNVRTTVYNCLKTM